MTKGKGKNRTRAMTYGALQTKAKMPPTPKAPPVELPIWEQHGMTLEDYTDAMNDPESLAHFDSDDPDKYPGWEQEYRNEDFM